MENNKQERVKRAKEARARMLQIHAEKNVCEICEPSLEVRGTYVEGKGMQCAHGKTAPTKL